MPDPTTGTPRPLGLGGIRAILREVGPAPVAAPVPAPEAAWREGDRLARPMGLGGIRSILSDLNRQAGSLPPTPPAPEGPPPAPWPAPAPEREAPLPTPRASRPWSPLREEGPPPAAQPAPRALPVEAGQQAPAAAPKPAKAPATKPAPSPEAKAPAAAPKAPEAKPSAPQAGKAPEAKPSAPKAVKAPSGDEYRPQALSAHGRFAGLAEVGRPMASGAEGPAVVAVQEALQAMAFVIPAGATGSYGPQTTQAVKNFQAFAGLPRTGKLDAATWKALERLAPPPGLNAWDPGADPGPIPSPDLGQGKKARVVVGIGQHRAFLFDKAGKLVKIYAVRTGREGMDTKPGLRVVDGKNDNPKEISDRFWPDAGGRAFGDRLLGLTQYDLATGKKVSSPHNGQELHGTDQEASIGRDFSHGCVGLTNADIHEIYNAVSVGSLVRFDA